MSESEAQELDTESQEVELEVLEQLVPRLPGLQRRVGVGLVLILLATMAGVGTGRGYIVPDPFPADFEVREVVVSPFGNGDDVYVQFAVANRGQRDIQLDSMYQDNGPSPRVGAFAERPDLQGERGVPWDDQPFAYADGVPSILNYVAEKRNRAVFSTDTTDSTDEGERVFADDLTRGIVALPATIPARKSIIVTMIFSARGCSDPSEILDSLAAEVRFASYQRLLPTRTERFEFSDDVNVLAIKETGETASSVGLAEAICEVVG